MTTSIKRCKEGERGSERQGNEVPENTSRFIRQGKQKSLGLNDSLITVNKNFSFQTLLDDNSLPPYLSV